MAFLSGLLWWHCNTNHIQDQVFISSEILHFAFPSQLHITFYPPILTGGITVFLLNLLGILPNVQCHICIPTRTPNAHPRTLLRHVSPLVLLLCPNCGRFTNGARSSNHLRHHNILDGRLETFLPHILLNSPDRPLQRARLPELRPSPRRRFNGC